MAVFLTPHRRRRFSQCVLVAALGLTSAFASAAEKPLTSVADLRYGVVLYEYYQQNYLNALSELMVAEAEGGIKGHKENPRLIEGGISLAYGMDRKAGVIFNDLLTEQQPQDVRNAAWYYLAKLRYLHSDWQGSAESLARIDGKIKRRDFTDLDSLTFNLALRQNDLTTAAAQLAKLPDNDPERPYQLYNLGVAYSRAGDFDKAFTYYQQVVTYTREEFTASELLPVSVQQQQQETLALYDKARTAAGYSLMLQQNFPAAIDRFQQVRRDSAFSEKALLGFGWAAAQMDDYARALQPWQMLSHGNVSSTPVQEALLAVPYAYEQLEAPGEALQAFVFAEQQFEQEQKRLSALAKQIQQGHLRELLALDDDQEGWLSLDKQLLAIPEQPDLTRLFSTTLFQGSVQSLQDLLQLQAQLDSWEDKLDNYHLIWQERHEARLQNQQLLADRPWQQKHDVLVAQRQQLQDALSKAIDEKDYMALAQGDTARFAKSVARIKANIDNLESAGKDVEEFRELFARYQGLLYWDASEQAPGRMWDARRNLQDIDRLLAQLAANQQRFEVALTDAPDYAPFEGRLAALNQRLSDQRQAVNLALAKAEQQLTQQIVSHLDQQQQRLRQYLAHARLAKARLYDAALQER